MITAMIILTGLALVTIGAMIMFLVLSVVPKPPW